MCTAVLSIEPGLPVLLAGVRDELTDRAWEPPGRHWPQYPGLIGGRDLQAGGTWLAVSDQDRRVGCVLNAIGAMAPAATRRSRGSLPLTAAAGGPLDQDALADLDPFHLLTAEPAGAIIQSWDGRALTERTLPPGLHFVVNSGLASELAGGGPSAGLPAPQRAEPAPAPNGREHELARIAHFLERPAVLALDRASVNATDLEVLGDMLLREFGRSAPGRQVALRGLVAAMLANVMRLTRLSETGGPNFAAPECELVARFRRLVERRYREHAGLAAYAAELGVSQARLRRACLGVAGQSPAELVHLRLLVEAERQLRYSSMSIAQIAYHLGFHDPAYFSRFFTTRMRLSPREFRSGRVLP